MRITKKIRFPGFFLGLLLVAACDNNDHVITRLADLEGGRKIAVPGGTVADKMALQRFPDAKIEYYNSVYDCALAVLNGKADGTVYDKPVLENLAAKTQGGTVLEELLMPDVYGFAVAPDNEALKATVDSVLQEINTNGIYKEMLSRWFPKQGAPGPVPVVEQEETNDILRFGTAAVTEPMAYVGQDQKIEGFDIELALYIAKKRRQKLEIVNMEFGGLLPALISGKVDLVGAGLSITEERAKKVLFSEPYYNSGIAVFVRKAISEKQTSSDNKTGADRIAARDKLGVLMGDQKGQAPSGKMSVLDDIADKKIGIFTGTVHDAFVSEKYPKAGIARFESTADMMTSLKSGKIDVAMFDLITANLVMKRNADLGLLSDDVYEMPLGVGFNKNNPALLQEFNDFLKEIRQDGTYEKMTDRWFAHDADEAVMPQFRQISSGKKLVAGVSVEDLPYVAVINDQYVGFDIEMLRTFADRRDYEVEFVNIEFPALVAALSSGKVDLISDGICISPERAEQVNFSDQYALFRTAVIAPRSKLARYDGQVPEPEKRSFATRLGNSFYNNIIRENRYMMILRGLLITILISVFASLTGTVIGGLVCAMRMSGNKLMNSLSSFYISLIRGTPVLVLLMIIYYVVFASVNINPVLVAILAFGINFGAYVSEMFRTSIESIDKGQTEAGVASGFTKAQTFIHIIMPQALRRVLPVYKGEFISLVKMTSVVGYIAVEDLTKASDIIRSRTFDAFFPLIMAAVIYIFIAWLMTLVLDYIEINVDPKRRRLNFKKLMTK
ncbi:MAG: ABC transporter permease subunit [Mangrovibacterium sp.]